jgi:hypothetical protein
MFYITYIMFILPESVSRRRMLLARNKHERENTQRYDGVSKSWWDSLNPTNIVRPLVVLFPTGKGSSPRLRLNLMLLAATDSILFSVGIGGMTVIIYYAESRFGWGNFEVMSTCFMRNLI